MIKAEVQIGICNKGDRWLSIKGKDPTLPFGRELQTIALVEIPILDMRDAIEAFRAGNQSKTNEILTRYY